MVVRDLSTWHMGLGPSLRGPRSNLNGPGARCWSHGHRSQVPGVLGIALRDLGPAYMDPGLAIEESVPNSMGSRVEYPSMAAGDWAPILGFCAWPLRTQEQATVSWALPHGLKPRHR